NTPLYRWGNRVSIYTGLPAVVGWDWHQRQQRWDNQEEVFARRADVLSLYDTLEISIAEGLLEKYNVRYIYVGQLERLYYDAEGIDKFDEMVDQGLLEVVYPGNSEANPEVTIYRVVG
ncbi:MAG: hypothetical protein V3U26_04880, partial [Dehalococcoidia bacterium]